MTETKWTPGPWAINRGGPHLSPFPIAATEICCGLGPDDEWVIDAAWTKPIYDEERSATAHLISAAPDLYDALERLSAYVRAVQVHPDPNASPLPKDSVLDGHMAAVDAALAKAHGEDNP